MADLVLINGGYVPEHILDNSNIEITTQNTLSTNVVVSRVTTSSPLRGGGTGMTIQLSMDRASASRDGFLSKEDWARFNAGGGTGTLDGDVTGDSDSNVVASVGGVSASTLAVAANTIGNATTLNTGNTLVLRSGTGDFAARNITANAIKNLASPSQATDAANKTYVDTIATYLTGRNSWKTACRLATAIGDLVAIPSSLVVIDGVQTNSGDRVLIKGIGLGANRNNGIYIATSSGQWPVADDGTNKEGMIVLVTEGDTNANSIWKVNQTGIDSETLLTFSKIWPYTASDGIFINSDLEVSSTVAGDTDPTPDTIVARDSNGDIAVNDITADGTITADTLVVANNIDATVTESLDVRTVPVVGKDRINSVGYTLGQLVSNPIVFDPAGYVTVTRGNSIGAIFPTGSGTFRGFPNLEIFPSGRIWIAFSVGASHGATGSITQYVYSDDNGHTWTAEATLAPVISGSPSSNSHLSSTGLITTGPYKNRLFLTFWTDASTFTQVIWSDDFGATWSEAVNCYDPGAEFSTYVVSSTPFVAPDGSILAAGYGHITGETYYKATCIKSTNGGTTWSRVSVIYDGSVGADAVEQPEEPQMILLNDGVTILCSVREDGNSSATANKGTIRFVKSVDSGATWTSLSKAYPGAFYGYGRPNLCQTENGTIICVTRQILSILPDGDGIVHTSHDNGATWDLYRKVDARNWFYSYGDIKHAGRNQIAFAYGVQNAAFSRSDVCFTYLLDGDGVSPFGGAVLERVRATRLTTMSPSDTFLTPPTIATATDGTTLQTQFNALVNYLGALGIGGSPLNCSSITGLWEADTVSNTNNDLTGTFGSDTHLTSLAGADVTPTTSGGSFGVTSNKLQNATPSGANVIYWDTSNANGTFEADFTWNGSTQSWMIFRVVNNNTFLMVTIGGSNVILYKDVAGSTTVLSNPALGGAFTGGVEQHIKVVLNGATITCTVGSTQVINHTLSAGDQTTFLSPTKHGFFMSDAADRVDNVTFHTDLITGSSIGYVPDQSANAYHLTNSSGATQPTIYLAGSTPGLFNEKPFLKVYNTQNLFTSSFTLQAQPNAYVGVFFFDVANVGSEYIMRCKYGSSYNQGLYINTPGNSKKIGLYAGTVTGTAPESTNGVVTPGGPYIISAYFNGASSYIRVNGKTVMRQNSSNHIGSEGIDQFQLGDPNAGAAFLTPGVCVLAHGSPTLAEIRQCELYFAYKYNIRLAVSD